MIESPAEFLCRVGTGFYYPPRTPYELLVAMGEGVETTVVNASLVFQRVGSRRKAHLGSSDHHCTALLLLRATEN